MFLFLSISSTTEFNSLPNTFMTMFKSVETRLIFQSTKEKLWNYFQEAVAMFHKSGLMHQIVGENVGKMNENFRLESFPFRNLFWGKYSFEKVSSTSSKSKKTNIFNHQQQLSLRWSWFNVFIGRRLAKFLRRHYLSSKEAVVFWGSEKVFIGRFLSI